MGSRLGLKWFNQVQQLAVPTQSARFSRFALYADRINALEPILANENDDQLRARSHALRQRARQGESINRMIVEAFALVREAAKRTIGQRHFDVQLVGGC